jgi:hypothetical protein
MSTPEIAGLVFLLLSMYMLKSAIYSLREAEHSKRWPSVTGKILEYKVSRPKATSNYRILYVEYEYCANNKRYMGTRNAFYTLSGCEVLELEKKYNDSDDVNVYFDPNFPQKSALIVGPREGKKYSDLILACLGIVVGLSVMLASNLGYIG